eukprot:COSAG02_NODE_3169_length_7237_cov_11.752592_6_plen_71_part_00
MTVVSVAQEISLLKPVIYSDECRQHLQVSLAESETLRHVTEITFDHESDSPRELVGEVNLVEPILSDAYL